MSIANSLSEVGKAGVSPAMTTSEDCTAVPPAITRSLAAFARDLPLLLETNPRRWVAYVDGNQLRIADTQTELYRQCLYELGLQHDQFIVTLIIDDCGGAVEYTPR
jgi:hypothetical protein